MIIILTDVALSTVIMLIIVILICISSLKV